MEGVGLEGLMVVGIVLEVEETVEEWFETLFECTEI
jgi:hypothetical protein